NEDFQATINSAASGIGSVNGTPASGTGTINANDTPTLLSVQSTSFLEGSGGGNQLVGVTVTISNPSSQPIDIAYSLAGSGVHPATLGTDFSDAAAGIVTIPGNGTSTTVNVPINIAQDNVWEPNETFGTTVNS